jgi:pSer/pThr/pTyr-binding forkhead associated (FHA) protein
MAVARLRMLKGPDPGRVYMLTEETVTIGRLRKNEIHIQDDEISKEHCRLIRMLNDYEIHDLNSTNGTFVNGKPIQAGGTLLTSGNKVELGSTVVLEFMPADDSQLDDAPSADGRAPQLVLMIRRGNAGKPDPYPMNSPEITIGRALDNEIVIPEPQVSKHHMKLIRVPEGYILEDLGSLNGTYVNEERLSGSIPLSLGDHIRVGTALEMTYTNESISATGTHEVPRTEPDTVRDMRSMARLGDATEIRTGQLQSHLFLLSARDDREQVAEKLFMFLKSQQIPVWIDRSLTPEGDAWNKALEHALIETPCLIATLTPESLNRPYVQRAIRTFINKDRPVLLLREESVRVPMFARNCPSIVYNAEYLEPAFRALLMELKRLR